MVEIHSSCTIEFGMPPEYGTIDPNKEKKEDALKSCISTFEASLIFDSDFKCYTLAVINPETKKFIFGADLYEDFFSFQWPSSATIQEFLNAAVSFEQKINQAPSEDTSSIDKVHEGFFIRQINNSLEGLHFERIKIDEKFIQNIPQILSDKNIDSFAMTSYCSPIGDCFLESRPEGRMVAGVNTHVIAPEIFEEYLLQTHISELDSRGLFAAIRSSFSEFRVNNKHLDLSRGALAFGGAFPV